MGRLYKPLLFLSILCTCRAFGFTIESSIPSNEVIVGSPFPFTITVRSLAQERLHFEFPEQQSFRYFQVLGSRQESARQFSTNGSIQELRYTFTLIPLTNGTLSVPSVAIEVVPIGNERDSYYQRTAAATVVALPARPRHHFAVAVLVLAALAGVLVGLFVLMKYLRAKKVQRQALSAAEIRESYRERIMAEERLRFHPDKSRYLAFLLRTFRSYYQALPASARDGELHALSDRLRDRENQLKFSKNSNNVIIENAIRDIERVLLHT